MWQSKEIAQRTSKAVFCVDDRSFIQAKVLEGNGWDKAKNLSKIVKKVGRNIKNLSTK
ncbi:MAG: hypothetical protein ACJAUT_000166 [Cellvibrionaceae bacterium]